MNRKAALLTTSLFAFSSALHAQLPLVDIAMTPIEDGRLEVRMRADGSFDGLFAALVFTVRWPASSAATIGEFTPTDEVGDYGMYPTLSGDVVQANGFNYAVMAGFGAQSLGENDQEWLPGVEFVLGHFDVFDGPADFQLVNDDWTGENNGDFYVSLNGDDRTGVIYSLPTAVHSVRNDPNVRLIAADGGGSVVLELSNTVRPPVRIEVLNPAGQLVRTLGATTDRVALDGRAWSPGVYLVRITSATWMEELKWLVGRP